MSVTDNTQMNTYKSSLNGIGLLLLAQLMVGVNIVGSKYLLSNITPVAILTIRFGLAFLILVVIHFGLSKNRWRCLLELNRRDWAFIIAQALCAGAFFNILLLLGMHYTSASIAGIITSALPAVVAILSIIFLKERLTRLTLLCIIFALFGLLIINAHNLIADRSNHILGDLIIFIALLPDAAYYVMAKVHKNQLPIFLVAALMNGINVPVFLAMGYFEHTSYLLKLSSTQIWVLFFVGLSSALFYVFWFLGCKNVKGTVAGLTTAFMPIATLFIAWGFLGESITLFQLIGMILVIGSIFLNVRDK